MDPGQNSKRRHKAEDDPFLAIGPVHISLRQCLLVAMAVVVGLIALRLAGTTG